MPGLICDPLELERLIRQRRESGADRYDEVWNGVYIVSPVATVEHQRILTQLVAIFFGVLGEAGHAKVYPGVNVTDRNDDWTKNYRCPDVVVVLEESKDRCRDIGPALLGGPDFLAEVCSPEDKTFEKLDFYAAIGVRELLVVDRDSKSLRLHRLRDRRLIEVSPAAGTLESQVLGLTFRTLAGAKVEVRTVQPPQRRWII